MCSQNELHCKPTVQLQAAICETWLMNCLLTDFMTFMGQKRALVALMPVLQESTALLLL